MALNQDLVGDSWRYDPQYHKMADFLGINKYDRDDGEVAQKISLLWDWSIMSSKGSTPEDYLLYLYDLRGKLGIPSQGKTLLHDLHQYARLDLDRRRIENDRKEQAEKENKKEEKMEVKEEKSTEVKDEHTT